MKIPADRMALRFSDAVRHDPDVDDWLARHERQSGERGRLARTWFTALRACGDDVCELLHDGHPTACVGDAPFAEVNVFTAWVNVGFFHGAVLDDPDGLLEGTGKFMRHVKLRPGKEPSSTSLQALITASYAHIRQRLLHG